MKAKESELYRRITEFMDEIQRDFPEDAAVIVMSAEQNIEGLEKRLAAYGLPLEKVAAYSSLWKDPEESRLAMVAKEFVEFGKKEGS